MQPVSAALLYFFPHWCGNKYGNFVPSGMKRANATFYAVQKSIVLLAMGCPSLAVLPNWARGALSCLWIIMFSFVKCLCMGVGGGGVAEKMLQCEL